jgi:Arsenical resistance operon protein ArsD
MTTVEIFDPAMCCSTGVCGTDVDPTLSRFASDLDWLTAQGAAVTRATLSQEPGKFVTSEPVKAVLESDGTDGLPAIVVDGALVSSGRYPTRAELAGWANVAVQASPAPVVTLPMAEASQGCCGGTGTC